MRRARTAAGFPERLVEVEDRSSALEQHVAAKLDEMRSELAEIRALLAGRLEAEAEATALIGRLLQVSEARLEALERDAATADLPGGGERSLGIEPADRPERSRAEH